MGFEYLTEQELYKTQEEPGINWITSLEILAGATEESESRNVIPFNFISDIRGINAYVREVSIEDAKKNPRDRLFREGLIFAYNRKGYLNCEDVSSALNSKLVRRVENPNNRPSYYQTDSRLAYETLDKLSMVTRELLVPVGIGFCDRFGCDREGKLLYK